MPLECSPPANSTPSGVMQKPNSYTLGGTCVSSPPSPRIHAESTSAFEITEPRRSEVHGPHRKPRSQTSRRFLHNYVRNMASVDFFHGPDRPIPDPVRVPCSGTRPPLHFHFGVAAHPTPRNRCGKLFPGTTIPVARSRSDLRQVVRGPGESARDRGAWRAPRSPWQRAYVERLIGSIRRECLDHVIVFGERAV
jgi:hypothetical protein